MLHFLDKEPSSLEQALGLKGGVGGVWAEKPLSLRACSQAKNPQINTHLVS